MYTIKEIEEEFDCMGHHFNAVLNSWSVGAIWWLVQRVKYLESLKCKNKETKLPWYITMDAGLYIAWDETGTHKLGSYNTLTEAEQRVNEYAKILEPQEVCSCGIEKKPHYCSVHGFMGGFQGKD